MDPHTPTAATHPATATTAAPPSGSPGSQESSGSSGSSVKRTGRPRSAAADRAILQATREALAEQGWGALALGDVAARAGVAKTTLYRRWAGKNELVVDAIAALFEEQLELPDLGSLAADIEGVVLRFAELIERPETRTALMAVVAEATHDEALRLRIREAIVDRQKHLVTLGRQRAQKRGELPPDGGDGGDGGGRGDGAGGAEGAHGAPAALDGAHGPQDAGRAWADPSRDDLIFDVIAGTVVHRVMVSSGPVDQEWARQLARLLVGGLGALHLPPP
ncbi:transcriptional regulator, TetR family [Actinacidiphila rubida]|uniref:Transcriptional regulator, TetR family n=2 Tax=Actinacidiphila rubida TaxID=310780 RepID=A0A1H8N162_9ACTN|nr:TetR/AcrR family transcriptional regulator [Actinacidiphila rubida]SEO23304.1 transcriptional regulator, TetR family [Actinacidiphila rubida]